MKKLLAMTALVTAVGIGGAAEAQVTVYTTQASYLAAVGTTGVDTFESLSITGVTASPITRTAGSYGYTATAAGGFYGAGTTTDHWLSTNTATDNIVLSAFTGGVRGIGGLFFGSDIAGAFIATPGITLSVTDASGVTTRTIVNPTTTSFLGFVSTTGILGFTINSPTVDPLNGPFYFPTANNLTLAGPRAVGGAVPEPATWGMMILGFGTIGAGLRYRRRSTKVSIA